jgi:hypothetical protein
MHILFGKKKTFKELSKPTLKLAPNFAQEVMELEEQVNLNCTVPTVTRLMSLYKQAIEYYEADKNLKHIHYQERMQSLMTKNNVILLLTNAASPVTSPRPTTQIVNSPKSIKTNVSKSLSISSPRNFEVASPRNLEITSPIAIHVFSPKSKPAQADLVLERNCDKVLSDRKTENFDLCKKIHENLKNQSENLNQRLLHRKLAQTPKISKRFTFEETNQCDISAGESKLFIVEEFEKNIEGILEKFIEMKNREKRKIQEKYQEYFDQIESIKGEVKDKLTQELNRNMEKELFDAMKGIDLQRENELASERKKLKKSSNMLF